MFPQSHTLTAPGDYPKFLAVVVQVICLLFRHVFGWGQVDASGVVVVVVQLVVVVVVVVVVFVQVIRLRFTHVSLSPGQTAADAASAACDDRSDSVVVEEHGRKRVCVTTTTTTVVTRSNQATLTFISNELGHALGFRAFYRAGQL